MAGLSPIINQLTMRLMIAILFLNNLKNAKNEKERRMIIQKAYQDRSGHYFPKRGNKSFLVFIA